MRLYRHEDLVRLGIVRNRMAARRWRKFGFPPAIGLGPNSTAWDADAVDAWVAERAELSRKAAEAKAKEAMEAEHAPAA